MSINITASRYAVLKVDEEADSVKKVKGPKQPNVPKNAKVQPGKLKPLINAQTANANITAPSKKKSKAKVVEVTDDQWDAWQEKDKKMMDRQYERDLELALLDNKDENKKSKNKKKSKPSAIPLENFLEDSTELSNPNPRAKEPIGLDENTMKEIQKGVQDIFRMDNSVPKKTITNGKHDNGDQFVNVRLLEYQEELSKKSVEILSLQEELQKSKDELGQVKLRNKKLCGILGAGEMREKAEILLEVDKLSQEKVDLTAQVAQLHTSLEQERSKVHSLQNELKKSGGAPRKRTDSVNK